MTTGSSRVGDRVRPPAGSWRRWHDGPGEGPERRAARLWPALFAVCLAAVAAVLAFAGLEGATQIRVAATGDLIATISLVMAARWYRPSFRPVSDLLIGAAALLTVTTAILPWTMHGTAFARWLGLVLLVVLNLATPVLAFYCTRPYLRTEVLWDRMVPIVAFVVLLPVVGLSRANGQQFDRRAIVALLGVMYVVGLLFAGPVLVRLRRIADLLMYLCMGILFANIVIMTGGAGAVSTYRAGPIGQFVYIGAAALAIWHPSMTTLGRPLDVGAVSRYAHGRTIWIAAFVVVETVIFAVVTRHNAVAVAAAISCAVATCIYIWWSVATGRSSASAVVLERSLRRAIASGELRPARQPLLAAAGTPLGSVVWARWIHRRLGVLPASEWWHLARRADLTSAVEREVLRSLLESVSGPGGDDAGVLVITLDDPAAHAVLLSELGQRAAVVVRCDRGFDAVHSAGCRVATSLELAALGRADIVEIPMSVTSAVDSPSGRAVFDGMVRAASGVGALTMVLGVESAAAEDRASGAAADLMSGFRFGRPELPTTVTPRATSNRR